MHATQTESEVYNVQCHSCQHVWSPMKGSGLWKGAKHRCETQPEKLDAMYVGPKTCGCERPVSKPDAPYRVFGYDMMCEDYDIPCDTFIQAVRLFRRMIRQRDVVYITGVSSTVADRIEYPLPDDK